MNKLPALAIVAALMVGGVACGTASDSPDGATERTTGEPSVAYKLAVIDGDPSEEAAFQAVLDCIKASGIEGAETEEQIGDTLVASWQQSGQRDSLLEWAQAFC